MTSIFQGQPSPQTNPNFQQKQGAPLGFQVYIINHHNHHLPSQPPSTFPTTIDLPNHHRPSQNNKTNFQTFTKERFRTGGDAGPDWTPSDWPVMENICIIYLHLDPWAGIFTYICFFI